LKFQESRESRITRALCQVAPDEAEANKIEAMVANGVIQRKNEAMAAAKRRVRYFNLLIPIKLTQVVLTQWVIYFKVGTDINSQNVR